MLTFHTWVSDALWSVFAGSVRRGGSRVPFSSSATGAVAEKALPWERDSTEPPAPHVLLTECLQPLERSLCS